MPTQFPKLSFLDGLHQLSDELFDAESMHTQHVL